MSSILRGIKVNVLSEDENRLAQLEMALSQARQATKNIKYDNTVNDIIAEIQGLAQKYGMDAKSVKWAIDDVIEAKNNLESAVYGLEEVFKDAWQNEKWDQEDKEGLGEGVRDLGYDAQSLIMKLRRDIEEKRLQPTPQAVLAAARELAGDMDFAPQLLVKQVLGQGMTEAPTRVPAVPSKILSATDDGKIITIKVRAPDGSTRSMSNSNPSILQKWLNLKFGLRLPQEISSKFVFEDDVDEANTNYHANRTGFSRGQRDDERHDLDVAKQQWALKINGKVWSKDGKAVAFDSKEKALKARQSLLAKKPDLEVGLVTRQLEGYSAGAQGGAGLGIEKSPIEKIIERPFGVDEHINSPGGMGQAYRKFKPKSAGVAEGAPELLKAEMPLVRHIEQELAKHGVQKDDPEYKEKFKHAMAYYRKFGNIDAIKKNDVAEEQAPMFTPEEKMVNANDPRSDGWRIYKAKPAGTSESSIMKGLQNEAGGVTRWSKENPPPPELLLNTLVQILMKPENQKSPQDLISLWNDKYGLKHTLGSLRQYAQNDYKKMELSKALQKAALANESSEGK
jgi:hypothetical protein